MSDRIHALVHQLFGKSSLEDCDVQEIRTVVNKYPYFAPAQFLYLEKLRNNEGPEFDHQLQKAALYYHNPLSFEYFISSEKFQYELEPDTEIHEDLLPVVQEETVIPVSSVPEKKDIVDFAPDKPVIDEPVIDQKPADEEVSINEETPVLTIASVFAAPALTFEPFHTVDYFASQGIKLSGEELPKDKLGKQLKSFTEWLKTMKKLPSAAPSTMDTASENKVLHMAEDSVHDADVITEAMAEVWIKQGNTSKALEVYNKLVLHNPSKKAYFAAKIENLKRS